jgi:hypothetical protein
MSNCPQSLHQIRNRNADSPSLLLRKEGTRMLVEVKSHMPSANIRKNTQPCFSSAAPVPLKKILTIENL